MKIKRGSSQDEYKIEVDEGELMLLSAAAKEHTKELFALAAEVQSYEDEGLTYTEVSARVAGKPIVTSGGSTLFRAAEDLQFLHWQLHKLYSLVDKAETMINSAEEDEA
jgi:hypothetical protein